MVAAPSLFDEERLRAYVLEAAGEEGLKLVRLLEEKREATDSELAAVLGSKPSHVRKILYNLYEARVAEYTKEKDKETGWLTFFWHPTPDNAAHAIEQRRRREIEGLRLQLESERTHDWFVCPKDHERYDFTDAAETDFHCANCGTILAHEESNPRLAEIQQKLVELESEG